MSIYRSTAHGTTLIYRAHENTLGVNNKASHGYYVLLSDADKRELALELLGEQFSIRHESDEIILTKKRPPVEVGQYYRVKSTDNMMPEFRDNPLVKVTELRGIDRFTVETESGKSCQWTEMARDKLEGPLDVVEVTVKTEWRERKDVEA